MYVYTKWWELVVMYNMEVVIKSNYNRLTSGLTISATLVLANGDKTAKMSPSDIHPNIPCHHGN